MLEGHFRDESCFSGFSSSQISFFDGIWPTLSIVIILLLNYFLTEGLFRTYLGDDAGSQVVRGSVVRGDTITMKAAIWLSDIRSFTSLSTRLDRKKAIHVLNVILKLLIKL